MTAPPRNEPEMYGENDLSSMAIFSGNFINFGYWQGFTPGLISVEQRTESQADLYRTTLRSLMINPADVVLEVGCGIAVGAALALREFEPHAVYGLDLSADQLSRAIRVNAELLAQQPGRLILQRGSALALPFADATFDKCYSVEAAQHFDDLTTFACEAHRILRPGGRLAVSTFFTPRAVTDGELRQLIPAIDNGVDAVGSIIAFRNDLLVAGFVDIRVESIGNHGRFQAVMSTQCSAISFSKTSIGFFQPSVSRGLPFSSAASLSSSS
jgi:ubiquinone/menaquinone biosynthesis C-methylase UbiE